MKTVFKLLLMMLIAFTFSCEKDDPTSNNGNNNGGTTTTKSSAKDITKFSFAALSPAVDATIDAAAKTISTTLPATTDLTKLVPTITISAKATVSPNTGVVQDFSKEISYTVTAEDGSTAVWKVAVKKEVVVNNTFTITSKAKIPTLADMGDKSIIFSINSKIYCLGNSKASFKDFKYFFEYDPATNKWTQKVDFPFQHNLDGTGTPTSSNFIHNDKFYFSSNYYGYFEYDPTLDKWTDLKFSTSNTDINPFYDNGILYTFYQNNASAIDLATKTIKNYNMTGGVQFGNKTVFKVDNKFYFSSSSGGYGTDPTKISIYEADITNGKYTKKSSEYEIPYEKTSPNNTTNINTIGAKFLIEGNIYYLLPGLVYIYDTTKDSYQSIKMPNLSYFYSIGTSGNSYTTIGKTIYEVNTSSGSFRTIKIP